MTNIVEHQVQLTIVALRTATILSATVGEHTPFVSSIGRT
jgi:hypothetical protein